MRHKMRFMPQSKFIWQRADWPRFNVREQELTTILSEARLAQGRVVGKAQALGFEPPLAQALSEIWADEALATSAIEGEKLNLQSVRSSVARRLGLPAPTNAPAARNVEGLLDMMQDAVARHDEPLTKKRLCAWQAALFPTGRSGLVEIRTGTWRAGRTPMQIVSGPIGREKVHYEAPPAHDVPGLMREFLRWFAASASDGIDGLVRAAIAHLWFETIHPFEDGNGRVGRAIVDLVLAQQPSSILPLYRMSSHLSANRGEYYEELNLAQRGDLDATRWVAWFVAQFHAACQESELTINCSLVKARFWSRLADVPLSDRQRKVINKLLDAGPDGFEGGLSAGKYQNLTSSSRQTASRDLSDLVDKGVLRVAGERKSTRYHLSVPEWS
jgi:Fic family protein